MKPIKCEIHEPYNGYIKITYYKSIRAALRYCKQNGLSRSHIYTKDGNVCNAVFGNGMILSV